MSFNDFSPDGRELAYPDLSVPAQPPTAKDPAQPGNDGKQKTDDPALTRDDVRAEAHTILAAIDAARNHREASEDCWRMLWQLVREANAAGLPYDDLNHGPWHLSKGPDGGRSGVSCSLNPGNFLIPVWPPHEPRSETDLPALLNWAGVPAKIDNRRMSDILPRRSADRGADAAESAREAAESRREQAELHRRKAEEGRDIAETLRNRHEAFREQEDQGRSDAERLRDVQEAGREIAEQAREMAEMLRGAAEEARAVASDARKVLTELKDLARQQRLVLERQERGLAALEEARLCNSHPRAD